MKMSTEDQSDSNNPVTSRNHSHTPTPSTADVNAEASLISSSQLFTTSASLLDCVDSTQPANCPLAKFYRKNACRAERREEDHWSSKILRSIW